MRKRQWKNLVVSCTPELPVATIKTQMKQMCDRFVVGLRDMELRQKLELIDDLTLDQAVSLARRHEQVKITAG